MMPRAACTDTAVAGKVWSGVEVARTIRSIEFASTMRIGERRPRGMQREIGRELASGRDMAFANAGALHNPFVGGLNRTRKFIIADDARGQIASAAEHDRTQRRHELAPLAGRAVSPTFRSRVIDWPILVSNSYRTMS